jgi:hypothetical protein
MDKKSIISKIKQMFSSEENTEMFVDVKSQDGNIYRVSDIAVDATIQEVNEDGLVDIESATIVLESGLTLIVNNSIITEIIEVSEEENINENMSKFKKTMKRFAAKKRFEEAGVEEVSELTLITDEVAVGSDAIMITEELEVVEDWSGEVEVMVEDVMETVIIEEGVISEVVVTEEAPAEEVEEVVAEEEEKKEEMFSAQEAIEALRAEMEAIKAENAELKGKVETFAGAPSATPTKTTVDFKKASREEKLKMFSK